VAVAVYSPLAAKYVFQTLRSDPGIETVCAQIILDSHPDVQPVSVFVLDRGTLPFSLTKYLRHLRSRYPDTPALLIDEPRSNEELCRLLFLGIQGLVPYAEVDERLKAAIRAVCEGHLWIPPQAVEQYVRSSNRFVRTAAQTRTSLTSRERQILHLLQQRLTNKQIGSTLQVSESTVKFHLANIFSKVGIHDRHALLDCAVHNESGSRLLSGMSAAGKIA
jgi:DNA-binding NarL/FixJ family response regulator